jgi:hypothetical protein
MSQVRRIHTGDIVNFITDFTLREGRKRYRIRLHLHGGENLVFADYSRFEQYRNAWVQLHRARERAADLMVRQG